MAHSNGNVVALGDHPRARARLSPQESTGLLNGCRELALERMGGALSGMLDRVEQELFDLAEKAPDTDSRSLLLEARAQARAQRAAIEATFRRHFVQCFDRKVRGDSASPARPLAAGELTLVGHEDLEQSLAVSEMSRKLKAACEGELSALSQRMGFLLERPDLEDDANPVSPATICAALKDACDQIGSGFRERMLLLRQLERHAEAELQRIYGDLNAHLVARSILPEVRPVVRRAAASPAAQPAMPAPPRPAAAHDLFGTLADLLRAASAASPHGAAAAGGAAPGFSSVGSAPGFPGMGGGSAPAGASIAPPAAAPALVAELTRMHREAPLASGDALVNVVRAIREAPQAPLLGTVDAMTIDIVAMLFDYVFEDRHIPATVKALLGRLQIPILKVALLDKDFFSSRAHPARRVVDLLAAASIGLDETHARGCETLAMVEGVVDEVLREFDTDLALFEKLAARVEAFIEEGRRVEDDVLQRSVRLVEAREREEIARVVADEEVARRLATRAWVPPVVRAMLVDAWARALAGAQHAEGEGSADWHALAATMEDLLWSVEPKASPDERRRLVALLPDMLGRLHRGLQRAQVPQDDVDAFMGALVDCHAAAVKAGLRGLAALPEAPVREAQPPRIERAMVPAGDVQVEEIRLKSPSGSAPRNVFTRTGIWTNLQRGTWVEFARSTGASTRARLTWISPNKGVYLFTSPLSGASAVSISPEALAEQMRLGEARMLDDAPLVERAVGSMIASLRRGEGAAAQG